MLVLERQTVHISDDAGRIAMLEKRTIGTDDAEEVLTRYVYSNHLQSASLELDEEADIISYEEYHPYGTTAFQAKNASINAVAKRYRYTGKERDEESGLYYHGARYYIPWLCRWTAIDPLESKYAGMSPYNYCENNPIKNIDDDGRDIITITEKYTTTTTTFGSKYGNDASTSNRSKSLSVNVEKRKGADIFIYKKVTQSIQVRNEYNFKKNSWDQSAIQSGEHTYYQKTLNPFNPNSATGATTHLGYWMQDLLTYKINDLDSTTIGKVMSYDKNFSAYMTNRHKASVQWQERGSTLNTLDAFAPQYAHVMFGLALGEVFALAKTTQPRFLFRGTSKGYPGSPALIELNITPTSLDPAKATVFATASEKYGQGVLHIADIANDLKGVSRVEGNVISKLEAEVPVNISPTEFANKANTTISSAQARTILKDMGINIPSNITNSTISPVLESLPNMTQQQIQTFVNRAKNLTR
ncbi:MAG: RHS repeat-associated core domain-containing protein [Taibaiella sp.]|nr:RHS repeat-associated core domain-containing protein [Taibaiella sp.]